MAEPITLFQFPKAYEGLSLSPFCTKVESFLILNDLEYRNEFIFNPSKAPYKKLPYIEDSDGSLIADSSFIIEHLDTSRSLKMDQHLSPINKAKGHLIKRTLEEGTYWILFYQRWAPKESWKQVKATAFAGMPQPLRSFVPDLIRRDVLSSLWKQGVARLSSAERLDILRKDLSSLSSLIGDNKFLLGEKPSSYDCGVHSFLKAILLESIDVGYRKEVLEHSNLLKYTESFDSLLETKASTKIQP